MDGRTAIEWSDVVNAKYTAAQMERLRFEIEEGEGKVRGEVRKAPAPAPSTKPWSRRPGTRKPMRDPRGQKT